MMPSSPRLLPCAALSFLTAFITPAFAGQEISYKACPAPHSASPFDRGRWEVQLGVGGFHSLNVGFLHPETNDFGGVARLGKMLSDVSSDGWTRGNWELLVEAHGSSIVHGPGDVIAGGGVLLRYNFVQPEARWVPYIQIGAGGAYSDAHEERNQTLLGSEWSFHLQAGIGLRYLFSDECAFFVEGLYRHMSNADSADRNTGLDSAGGYIGISLFF